MERGRGGWRSCSCTKAFKTYETLNDLHTCRKKLWNARGGAQAKRKLHSGTKLLLTELKKEHLFTLEYYCCFVPLCLCVCVSSAWHVNYRVACARRGKCHSFCDAVPTLLPLPLPLHWRRRPCRRAIPIGSVGAQSAATVGGLVCRQLPLATVGQSLSRLQRLHCTDLCCSCKIISNSTYLSLQGIY